MIDKLKGLGFKTAPTLNQFVKKVDDILLIKQYNNFLSKEPNRTDFINFDSEGFALNENKVFFKGWDVCDEASGEEKKVALKDNTRIYFETGVGVMILGEMQMTDRATYNDLFIFFDGKLMLN